jgi:uncharacterized membrane protein
MRDATPEQATTTVPGAVRSRLRGIDVARGLAIVGMVMVHIGPQDVSAGGVVGAAYRSPHGRASILFIVLAGIGVSLLSASRDRAMRDDDAPHALLEGPAPRLWWRALVLLPIGLALQSLPVNVAVILQYYALYFIIASGLLHLGDRALLAVAAASATLGPVVLVWLHQVAPLWFEPGVPEWHDVARIVRDVVATGYYPAIVWTAPLAIGMWVGRRDLRRTATAGGLLLGGALAAAAGFLLSAALVAALGPAVSDGDWRELATLEPHNEMPLWVLTSTAIALAITGGCLLLARWAPRVVWPAVAFGQLAFSVYVLHVLVLAWRPEWLLRDAFADAWISVTRFTLVSVVLATAYRAIAARGPFELLLRAPWQERLPRRRPIDP